MKPLIRIIAAVFALAIAGYGVSPASTPRYSSSPHSYSHSNSSSSYVHGYTRSNGTHVNGYYRTPKNGTKCDNYSTYGNYNPHTGKTGTKHVPGCFS